MNTFTNTTAYQEWKATYWANDSNGQPTAEILRALFFMEEKVAFISQHKLLANFPTSRALVEAMIVDVHRRWQAIHANAIIGWSEVRTALQPLDCEYCTCTILSGESYRKADGPSTDVYAHAACESAD